MLEGGLMNDVERMDALVAEIETMASPAVTEATVGSAICASFRREERLQYRFMMAFQTLVLMLAVGTLILLLMAVWQAIDGRAIATLVSAGGAIVTGAAAKFLNDQRKDARLAFKAAQRGLEKHNCPAV